MNVFMAQVRREFWEHNGAFIITPLMIAGLLLAVCIYIVLFHANPESEIGSEFFNLHDSAGTIVTPRSADPDVVEYYIDFSTGQLVPPDQYNTDWSSPMEQGSQVAMGTLLVIHFMFMSIIGFVLIFYSLSSLHTDRKDRSVLFWKSMPVSETLNVLNKLFICALAVPLLTTLIAWAAQIGYLLLATLFLLRVDMSPGEFLWAGLDLPRIFFEQLKLALWLGAWYLPLYAWLLFASALGRRSPFLVATVPLAVVIAFEYLIFGTWSVADLLGQQFAAVGAQVSNYENTVKGSGFGGINLFMNNSRMLTGAIIAALLMPAAIWLRNHRFEI